MRIAGAIGMVKVKQQEPDKIDSDTIGSRAKRTKQRYQAEAASTLGPTSSLRRFGAGASSSSSSKSKSSALRFNVPSAFRGRSRGASFHE